MQEPIDRLRARAVTCRDLAFTAVTPDAKEVLSDLAEQFEQQAIAREQSERVRPHRRPAFKWTLS